MTRTVLLTGATGFVGKVVLEELLRRREQLGVGSVLVLVRAGDPEHAAARCRADVFASPCFAAHPRGWEARVEPLPGDVTRPGLGLAPLARARVAAEVTHVIHCAASVEFTLPLAEALAVNTRGALNALEIARACARLESYVGVSTAYVTPHPDPYGRRNGRRAHRAEEVLAPLPRDPESLYESLCAGTEEEARLLAETGHPNTYTLTKCLAEHLTVARASDLPVSIVRPSIVSACRAHPVPGWIDSAAAFAAFVAMIGAGKLRVLAGDPHTRLDVVPCDSVSERIVAAAFAPPPRGAPRIQHAVAGLASALPISLCREGIVDYFRDHPAGGRARVEYVGRRGRATRAAHALRHELPGLGAALWLELKSRPQQARAIRKLVERQRVLNDDFAYFTHATLDFASSSKCDPPLEPAEYLATVCRGVSRHLLRRADRPRRAAVAARAR
ncbi:MAG: NAD-dependent epimerase/dehydratase family protein [Deltaproteobacteria bacterium]|nr:MAG: NAD-dependent epimerase/dehydratase family protein [Deltaproteobacteria bacterium]